MNLIFEQIPNPDKKTYQWTIKKRPRGEDLGYIEFHTGWRKYVWSMCDGVFFDIDCTQEVVDFLKSNKDARQ